MGGSESKDAPELKVRLKPEAGSLGHRRHESMERLTVAEVHLARKKHAEHEYLTKKKKSDVKFSQNLG